MKNLGPDGKVEEGAEDIEEPEGDRGESRPEGIIILGPWK